MDVWDYFHQKESEFDRNSMTPDRPMFQAAADASGRRGRVFGNLMFPHPEAAFVRVHEIVVVRANRYIHREKYSYFLVVDDEEIGGYERDPTHRPPVHLHCGASHVRAAAGPISLKKALDAAWREISRRAAGP